jgi:hypothetical protein
VCRDDGTLAVASPPFEHRSSGIARTASDLLGIKGPFVAFGADPGTTVRLAAFLRL